MANTHESPSIICMSAWRPSSRTTLRSGEGGQTTILVALSIVVLLIALGLGTEWGFALTQRRLAQNAADAGALAAARLLAGSVRATSTGVAYDVYEEYAYCRAYDFTAANLTSFRPTSPTDALLVEWAAATASGNVQLPWRALAAPASCPTAGTPVTTGTRLVDPTAVFVRTTPSITYSSPIATIAGKASITASARAVARIVGRPIPLDGPSWPMVRHFNADDFSGDACGPTPPCDPTKIAPVTFWSTGNSPEMTYNNFMGLVDFSKYSVNANVYNGRPLCDRTLAATSSLGCVPQLIEQWDESGIAPNGKPDLTSLFGGGTACAPPAPATKWLTAGLEDPQNADKQCSLMNWIGYGFGGPSAAGETGPRGKVDLNGNWQSPPDAFQEAPSALPSASQRSVCDDVPDPLPHPSCSDIHKGDWVEAAQTGNVGNNVAAALRYFIDQHGVADQFEHVLTGPGGGSPEFGKKAVIVVYLWDCAEGFSGTPSGKNQWSLIEPKSGGTDCSDIHDGGDIGTAKLGRVHLFSAAPFTFYRGLVSGSLIQGYWGGLVTSDAGTCRTAPVSPSCQINPFSNSVFLVADD